MKKIYISGAISGLEEQATRKRFEGRVIMEGVFPLLQHKKKELINNGCNPSKFKITY